MLVVCVVVRIWHPVGGPCFRAARARDSCTLRKQIAPRGDVCAALFQRPQSSRETAEHVNRVKEETLRELKAVCSPAT